MALTQIALTTIVRGQWSFQTCAIKLLIRRLDGRQVAVTGLGGFASSITLGFYHSCAVLVSGFREGVGCVDTCAWTDGAFGIGAV